MKKANELKKFNWNKIINIILFIVIIFSFFLLYQENKKNSEEKINSNKNAKYIVDYLKTHDSIQLEVKDIILNNPEEPSSFTVTAKINNKYLFLPVIINNNFIQKDFEKIYFYIDPEYPINYTDDGSQYIIVYNKSDKRYNGYYYYCELYASDIGAGENFNGKYSPIEAGKIGN